MPCPSVSWQARRDSVELLRSCNAEDEAASLQVTLKHVSHYWMFYEAALKPWVHYVPVGQYDARDILPVHFLCFILHCLSCNDGCGRVLTVQSPYQMPGKWRLGRLRVLCCSTAEGCCAIQLGQKSAWVAWSQQQPGRHPALSEARAN